MTNWPTQESGTGRSYALLEVTPHLYPDVVGGIPLNVNSLATALSEDFDTTVVTNWMGAARPPTNLKYHLIAFPTRLVLLGNPISARMLKWLLAHISDFDLVHAHSHLFLSSTFAVFVAKLRGTRVVLTNHGFISFSQPIPLQRLWISLISKTILSMCDRILCFSMADADRIALSGADRSRIVVVPNGIDISDFHPIERTYTGVLKLVWLGRIVREKGLQELLIAISQLRHLEARVHLTLVGEGPEEAFLKAYAQESNISKMVSFQRSVENRLVPSVLASHDVMILPSLSEGLPRVAIEALATKMPLLCSSLPQLTSSLEDAAVYFPPGDVSAIAKAIIWAEGNREQLTELGTRGRSLVQRKFSWEATVQNRELLFLELIGKLTA